MTRLATAARRGVAIMLGGALTLGLGVVSAPHATAGVPDAVRVHIERADGSLARARTQLTRSHPDRAIEALLVVKRQVSLANTAALAQIGKPPRDPESDDPPGPPAVLAALSLEHRVATSVVGFLDGQADAQVVDALLLTLQVTHRRRDVLLDRVIALPEEGDRDEYADELGDRLGIYTQEVAQISSALSTYSLTPAAHSGLEVALTRVTATQAKLETAFGEE